MAIQWRKVTWYSKLLALALFIALPFAGFYLGIQYQKLKSAAGQSIAPAVIPPGNAPAAPKTAAFKCDGSKAVTATFYPGVDKYVDLSLSDGRKLSVPRAISASGARYANADESFVFWNKGDTAFITENGTTTFSGCLTDTP